MQTVCVIADIHGNLPALERVIADAGEVDSWLCAGDIVGYGPFPNECVDLVGELGATTVAGNHDLGAIGAIDLCRFNRDAYLAAQWTNSILEHREAGAISGFPLEATLAEADAFLVHGSPLDPVWSYVHSEGQASREFKGFDQAVCFHGHTHVPAAFALDEANGAVGLTRPKAAERMPVEPDRRYLVNVGSVGQPRDGDPRACYALYYPEQGLITLRRVTYDVALVQKKMEEAGLPVFLASRLAEGR